MKSRFYLEEHPWKIIESQFDPQKVKASESIFSLGNGAMGREPILRSSTVDPAFRAAILREVLPRQNSCRLVEKWLS